jgi:hypothetical protein
MGQSAAIDFWLVALTDLALAIGGIFFVGLTAQRWPWLVALAVYALIPAVVASTDRMVMDGPAVAGFVVLLWAYRECKAGVVLVLLALLPLVRETSVLLTIGVLAAWLMERRYVWALAAGASAVPAGLWTWFLASRFPDSPSVVWMSLPLVTQIRRFFDPLPRAVPPPMQLFLHVLDVIACACLLFAVGYLVWIAVRSVRSGRMSPEALIMAPSAMLAACSGPVIMSEAYAFSRVHSALLVWVALDLLRFRRIAPAVLVVASSLGLVIFRLGPFLRMAGR